MKLENLSLNKIKKIFENYPLYSQDGKDQKVLLELFIPNQNIYWLLTEGSVEEDDFIFFGYCKITDGEFGYVSFKELTRISKIIFYKIHKQPILLDILKNKYENNYNY